MKRVMMYRCSRAIALSVLAVVVTTSAAHADVKRTGSEAWYQQSTAQAREQARELFRQAVDKNLQLLRGDAMELYEQALVLWDNPDIRWNLALVLNDLGKYLSAYQELERTLRWGAALGAERLRDIRERMRVLETQRLARIEVRSDHAGADVRLDGQPWFQGVGSQSVLVIPGRHYIGATKSGYTPTSASMDAEAGAQYHVTLRMVVDHVVETRRWSAWMPWSVIAAGAAVAAVGAGLEWQARVHRDAAARAIASGCNPPLACEPARPPTSDQARMDRSVAIGAFAAGGTAVAVGVVLAWLNQARPHRPEATPSPVELMTTLSREGAGISALVRF